MFPYMLNPAQLALCAAFSPGMVLAEVVSTVLLFNTMACFN
jgi:hypothetical protein